MLTEKTEKNRTKYSCELCDFFTCDKTSFSRHCSTRKHILLTRSEKTDENKVFQHICYKCGKEYKSKQGLWSHTKI